MRAVTVTMDGTERRLALEPQDEPRAADGEAIVSVKAISLNNGEVRHALQRADVGYRPGWDVAGLIEQAPTGSGLAPGDRVVGLRFDGGWAERISMPVRQLGPIPEGVTFEAAAPLPVAALTALVGLSKKHLGSGDRLLVTGATGGVGQYAVQIAKAAGAHVSAFARNPAAAGQLRRLGADVIIASVEEAAASDTFDLVLEGVGGALLGHALGWLRPRGMIVQFGDAAGDEPTTFDARWFRLRNGNLFGGTSLYGFFLLEEMTRPVDPVNISLLLADLGGRVARNELDPCIGRRASWRDIDSVARALLARDFDGKAVLTVD